MKKKILQINTVANSGSTGRIAEGIGTLAQANDFESFVAYGRWAMPSSSRLIRIGRKADYLWHGVESRILDNHGLGSCRATREFLNTVDEISPDLVHLHNVHGYYLNYPMLFQYLAKKAVPVVWTLHDCWAFTGHCVHYEFCGCDRWKTQCHHCPQKKTYPASYLADRSRKNFIDKKHFFNLPEKMVIVPVSQWLARQIEDSFLRNHPRRVITNGIDTDVFHPYDQLEIKMQRNWQNKKIVLGVASVWTDRKGLPDFMQLAGMLPAEYQIILIGLSEKQMRNLPENVTGIARTESVEELAKLYSAADVFVNPTWEDNYPTTNLEALSCGTPVITYRTGGSPESVEERLGVVIPQGDLEGLMTAVRQIVKEPELCREYALSHFQQQERFGEYIELYKELLNF